MNSEFENFINDNREAFDNKMPDPAVLQRLMQQMEPVIKKKERAVVIPMRVARWAAACIIVLVGAGIFLISQKGSVKEIKAPDAVAKAKPLPSEAPDTSIPNVTPEDNNAEQNTYTSNDTKPHKDNVPSTMERESTRKQVMFAALNNMESPGRRIDAVQQAYKFTNKDNDIVDALANTMNNDPNTNVRLAALDALSKFHREDYVKKKLVAALKKQTDPMVQIGLIELLTKMRETSILQELDKIVNDANSLDAVKDHAYSSMFTLRS